MRGRYLYWPSVPRDVPSLGRSGSGAADRSRPSSRLFLPLNEVSSRRRSEPITGKRCEEGNERPVHPAQYTHLVLDSFVLLVGNHDVQYNCLA